MLYGDSGIRDFNPRTRMGCDRRKLWLFFRLVISIHAPGWGATGIFLSQSRSVPISIHAPGWGATCRLWKIWPKKQNFNPRTRVGCDWVKLAFFFDNAEISIHAPGWGATERSEWMLSEFEFQSTHPGGVRLGQGDYYNVDDIFQSTHPGGVRLHVPADASPAPAISVHAPGWGATKATAAYLKLKKFQSTHPGGVRPRCYHKEHADAVISIHAPGWGATFFSVFDMWKGTDFNPRTRVGCDPIKIAVPIGSNQFQSTHPGGVRRMLIHFKTS